MLCQKQAPPPLVQPFLLSDVSSDWLPQQVGVASVASYSIIQIQVRKKVSKTECLV